MVSVKDPTSCQKNLGGIGDLEMDDVLMPWENVCSVTNHFLSLRSLTVSSNHLSLISIPLSAPKLVSLTLEYNDFTTLSALSPLSHLDSLESLLLKGNKIWKITKGDSQKLPVFGNKLRYVDLSYNAISTWNFVDELADVFPGLEALRFSHNPIYESMAEELGSAKSVEEGYMLTLARLGNLKTLNFSNITTADRTNAEMYYLSRIGKAMAEVPESDEHTVTSQHKRYAELCEIYGAPNVVRKSAETINPDFLEARLISFTFYMPAGTQDSQTEVVTKEREIPKSFDIYRVKGVVGRAFNLPPLGLRLIWETGEWDPVAGYEDEENSDDEDEEDEAIDVTMTASKDKGKWMKREVEIEDGTRQVGFCVDGREARVRVEMR
jgi:tubulin-specific chaperone E